MAAPSIDEVQLSTDISRGAVGGPEFSTVVVIAAGGAEQRIAQRSQGLYRYDISHGMKTAAQARTLIAFFQARQGKARGFRYKDWADYTATNEPVVYAGGPTFQLIKTYTSGAISRVRTIYKPVASPAITLRRNAGAFSTFTIDTTTGIVSLTAQQGPYTITNISNAVNGVVTCSSPPAFGSTMKVWITGVVGMTGINDQLHEVAGAVAGNTFPIITNTTSLGTYVSGGTVAHYWLTGNPNVPDSFDWAGQFDCPVRFDTDQLRMEQADVDFFNWDSIPLVELLG